MTVSFAQVDSNQPAEDVEMQNADTETTQQTLSKHFTIAIDFGTTFSSVSFVALDSSETKRRIHLNQICSIEQYPDAPTEHYESRREVPTESWYPRIALRGDVVDEEPLARVAALTPDRSSEDENDRDEHGPPPVTKDDTPPNLIDEGSDDEDSREYFWGYGVQKQLKYPDTNRAKSRRIARSKLLLDESPLTASVRTDLRPSLNQLKRLKLIKNESDIIADFLEHLFRHTKAQLIMSHGFHDDCTIEFVLCVPAMWTQKACRTMQTAMAVAISRSGFGNLHNGSVDNLFIVSEPEAAAACVLADNSQRILVPTPPSYV